MFAAAVRGRERARLSGGNQQKVVVAREVARDPRVLIAAQPTRGLDVGAIEFVHRRLVEERDEGRAMLLVSLELEEVLSLADRILVLYEGQIVGGVRPRRHARGARNRDDGRADRGGRVVSEPHRPPEPRPASGPRRDAQHGRAPRPLPAGRRSHHTGPHRVVRVLRRRPRRPLNGQQPDDTYKAIFNGTGLNWFFPWVRRPGAVHGGPQPPADADHHDAADLHRPRSGLRVPLRDVQHRRSGPVHRRDDRRIAGLGGACRICRTFLTSCSPSARRTGGRSVGRNRRNPQGDRRRPRGDLDDHAQLDRALGGELPVRVQGGRSRTRRTSPSLSRSRSPRERSSTSSGATRCCRASTSASSSPIGCSILFWLTLNRTTLGYEVRAVGFNPEAASYGGISVGRNYFLAMGISGAFAGLAGGVDLLGWLFRVDLIEHPGLPGRLHRDRRRPPRPQHGGRHPLQRAPLRRAPERHVDPQPRPRRLRAGAREQPDADHPGARPPLRRRRPADPLLCARTAQAPPESGPRR